MKDKEQLFDLAQKIYQAFKNGNGKEAVAMLDKLQQWANNKGYIQGLEDSKGREWHDTE